MARTLIRVVAAAIAGNIVGSGIGLAESPDLPRAASTPRTVSGQPRSPAPTTASEFVQSAAVVWAR